MFLFSSFYHKIRKKETHYRLPSVVGEGFNIVLFLIGENRGFQQSKQHSSGPPKVFDQQENGSTRIGTITSFFLFFFSIPSVYEFVFLQQWFSNYGVCIPLVILRLPLVVS